MKGKRRPRRRRLCARGRPGHYEEELSSSSFTTGKNDVTCGKTEKGEGGKGAAIEAALSREMRQNRAQEKEKEGDESSRMEAASIYEGSAFPLKNNVSRNREGATSNREEWYLFCFAVATLTRL